MSVCVYIKADQKPDISNLFRDITRLCGATVADYDSTWPNLLFGLEGKSLTGIEVNQLDDTLEIRMSTPAHRDDYTLYRTTAMLLSKALESSVLDIYGETLNPEVDLDDSWIERNMTADWRSVAENMRRTGCHIKLGSLGYPLVIGPKLVFRNGMDTHPVTEPDYALLDSLRHMLWNIWGVNDSPIALVEPEPGADREECLTSATLTTDTTEEDFPMLVSKADLLTLADDDRGIEVMVPFEHTVKVFGGDAVLIDEEQVIIPSRPTEEHFDNLVRRASLFEPHDIWYPPIWPGTGFDDEQRTFLLKWNPAISSVSLEDYINSLRNILTTHLNWSIHDHDKARMHDRFFLLLVGDDAPHRGIVQSGILSSNPYLHPSWRGDGTMIHYCDLQSNIMLHPDKAPILTLDELESHFPGTDWRGGHSGVLLDPETAYALESLWNIRMPLWRDICDYRTVSYVDR